MIKKSEAWINQLPDAYVGILIINNAPNMPAHETLDSARLDLENELRDRFGSLDRKSLRNDPVLAAYDAFYRSFRKTYHVQLQLESVIFKGKNIFSPSSLVSCMFMAELKTGLLTAAHDFCSINFPLNANIASGEETYLRLDNTEQELKKGDLYIKDQQGILSSVIYGPDKRTQIQSNTNRALYTTYGPPGISKEQISDQLEILEAYVRLFAPQAAREELLVV